MAAPGNPDRNGSAADLLCVALLQLSVGDDPAENLPVTLDLIAQAAGKGATLVVTPEATNLLSPSRAWQRQVLRLEAEDPTLAALREAARRHAIWLLIGSLALRGEGDGGEGDRNDGRFANRSFLIAPDGGIVARYDKIHMFDVTISDSESYRESAAYRPGGRAVLAEGPQPIGMTVCYDLRFPQLYRRLAQAGATILTVPAAFNPTTGAAHWHVLLRARAIETGCFILAPAQCGTHAAPHSPDRPLRRSYGHSLIVAPWGEVLADGGEAQGLIIAELDLGAVERARSRIPSLTHDRDYRGP
ncbi:MAG: carbon-nitrogen hydrolase family protein [Paracoccus sp. (in: a-proteobacteria)]